VGKEELFFPPTKSEEKRLLDRVRHMWEDDNMNLGEKVVKV
jgi:hypothetical protein